MKLQQLALVTLVAGMACSCSSVDYGSSDARQMFAGATRSSSIVSYMASREPDSSALSSPRLGSAALSVRRQDEPEGQESEGTLEEEGEVRGAETETGTDPRDFASKFMPYYRFTELENGAKENNMSLFGLIPFNKNFATTYEWPIALERRAPDGAVFGPPTNPNITGDDEATGVGDLNMRFFYKQNDWNFGGVLFMPLAELWFPTATEDILGSSQFQLAPGFALVGDMGFWPHSFAALMNFYQFDVYGDDDGDVSFYKGRWFFMLPFPTMTYLLPEIQPIYNFEVDDFSLWIGPEVGQIISDGFILYIKPGWGIDNDQEFDRDFTFEFGWRWFF